MKYLIISLCMLITVSCSLSKKEIKEIDINFKDAVSISLDSLGVEVQKNNICSKDGKLYIADMSNPRVIEYDENLKKVNEFGRKGNGPGEFLNITNLVLKKDTLITVDISSNNLSYFDLKGNFLHKKGLSKIPHSLVTTNDGRIVVGTYNNITEGKHPYAETEILDLSSGKSIYSFKKEIKGGAFSPQRVIFSEMGKNLVVADPDKNLISIKFYDEKGEMVSSYSKNVIKVKNDKLELKKSLESSGFGEEMVRKYLSSIPDFKMAVHDIIYDMNSYVWVEYSGVVKGLKEFYLYDKDGPKGVVKLEKDLEILKFIDKATLIVKNSKTKKLYIAKYSLK